MEDGRLKIEEGRWKILDIRRKFEVRVLRIEDRMFIRLSLNDGNEIVTI